MSETFPHLPWFEVAERVGKATFRLYTDAAMGTGFLLMVGKSADSYLAILATAWHVVEDAMKGTSLRICDRDGREVVRSKGGNIAVMEVGEKLDSAIVIIMTSEEVFPQPWLLPILPPDVQLRVGADVGWMGYPGIVEPELCFFHGHISGTLKHPPVYLVDGVAINGVSGGPVFDDRCHLAGLVSAYLPNVQEDGVLPGVSWMVPTSFIYAWVQHHLRPRDLSATP